MTSRVDTSDTYADQQIRDVLDRPGRVGFTVIAGAGSGKTTSLVKALAHVTASRGMALRSRTQQVACVTYTEVAADEIHNDVHSDPLVYVSTIHSFLWEAIAPFRADIGEWIQRQLLAKIAQVDEAIAKPRTTAAKRDSLTADCARYQRQLDSASRIHRYTYSVGPDYGKGQLGHADIIKMVPQMIIEMPLLSKIIASRFPFIFVDESQDTTPAVVAGLTHVYRTAPGNFCLGFFGDPMQQIYMTGVGRVPIDPDWVPITKPENFRSSRKVLEVVNRVRAAADGDQQEPGRSQTPEGQAFFFVLPAGADRISSMSAVRTWLAFHTSNSAWTNDSPNGAKILVAMHRLAAARLGFANLHAAFHPPSAPTLSTAFDEGNSWPIAPFANVILPLSDSSLDDAETIRTLRKHGRILRDGFAGPATMRARLASAHAALTEIRALAKAGGPRSIGLVLPIAYRHGLIDPVPQLSFYLDPEGPHSDQVLSAKTIEILDAFMACDIHELEGYFRYVSKQSPYSTQHATKGAEFARVVVLLDDHEGALPAHSYDKLLGLKELSTTDHENRASGLDTTVDRSRRLLYVCVSRAQEELAVIIYADNVEEAILSLKTSGLAGNEEPRTLDDLTAGPTSAVLP